MNNFYPYILGLLDTINDWNEKLNGLSSKYLDSPAVGTVVVIGIFVVSGIVIAELNKK